jgi:hypothetical protein
MQDAGFRGIAVASESRSRAHLRLGDRRHAAFMLKSSIQQRTSGERRVFSHRPKPYITRNEQR